MDHIGQKDTAVFERISQSFNQQNFLALIGAKLESARKGEVITSCEVREDLTQQQGLLHGGVVTTLADITCGYTALSMMEDNMEVRARSSNRAIRLYSSVHLNRTTFIT